MQRPMTFPSLAHFFFEVYKASRNEAPRLGKKAKKKIGERSEPSGNLYVCSLGFFAIFPAAEPRTML